MDEFLNESNIDIDLEQYDIAKIVKLQALIRGMHVRNQMKSLRDEYLGIVDNIETSKNLTVEWDDKKSLSSPIFVKFKKKVYENKPKYTDGSLTDCERLKKNSGSSKEVTKVSVEIQTNSNEQYNDAYLSNIPPNPNQEGSQTEGDEKYRFAQKEDDMKNPACDEPVKLIPEGISTHTVNGATTVKTVDSSEFDTQLLEHHEHDESDNSSLTHVTALWENQPESKSKSEEVINVKSASILEVRKNIAMELLWVQQAISSRKNYLRLKSQME